MTNNRKAVAQGPRLCTTLDGFQFNPDLAVWRIPSPAGALSFNFTDLPGATASLREKIRTAFAAMVVGGAADYARTHLSEIRTLLRFLKQNCGCLDISELNVDHLRNYEAWLSGKRKYIVRRLRYALLAWIKTGAGGVSEELKALLPTMLTERHKIGEAVRTLDPGLGPLTDVEYEAMLAGLRDGYAAGEITHLNYTLAILTISLGMRPLQVASLKVGDFQISENIDGTKIYTLRISRLKQRKSCRARTLFRTRLLAPETGALVEQQCAVACAWAAKNDIPPQEAPIFPSDNGNRLAADGVTLLDDYKGHIAGRNTGARMKRALGLLRVPSERTGDPLNIFPLRLRRTFGTRAAAEGYSAEVIADLMDHSWTSSSLVYIETRPDIIERVDKALALKMAPLAQAFAGTLVTDDEFKDAETSPGGRIHFAGVDALKTIGGCGKHDFCGLAAPFACYTCRHFQPWDDAPHEELLDYLLSERDKLLQVSDERIASINDRTILAVADVVNQCAAITQGHR